MKTKWLSVAVFASVGMIAQANPGGFHAGAVAHSAPAIHAPMRHGGFSSFHSTPMRAYGSRPLYSGRRYSSFGMRSSPSTAYRRPYIYSSRGSFTRSGPFTAATIRQRNRIASFANHRNPAGASVWNQRNGGSQFRNGNNVRNGNNHLRGDWQKHVFARHSGDWHRDWNHHSDHWWNGHRCCFINGSWMIFNTGFDPWWPYWSYPDYYAYGSPYYGGYDYPNSYGYDSPYSYDYQPGDYDSGDYQGQQYYDQNSYPDQSQGYYDSSVYQTEAYYDPNGYTDQSQSNYSVVVAAQERLAREGYYHSESDGALGPEMRQALRSYQSSHGLPTTGYLDRDTVAAMGLR
jgi:Putative peptidoglycan binding domain